MFFKVREFFITVHMSIIVDVHFLVLLIILSCLCAVAQYDCEMPLLKYNLANLRAK